MTKRDFKNQNIFRIFLSYFRPHIHLFIIDMICALLVAAVDLVYPLVSRKAMYEMLPNSAYKTFFTVMFIVISAYIIRGYLQYVITYWGHIFGIRVETDMRREMFEHLQTLGYEFYDKNRTGSLMSRLTHDLFEMSELAHHGPEEVVISVSTIVGSLIVMYTMEWRLAVVISVLVPIAVVCVMTRRRKMNAASVKVKAKVAVINTEIESTLSGMRTAKAFGNEDMELEKFQDANCKFRDAKKDNYQQMGIFNGIMDTFTSLMSVIVIVIGGYLIMEGELNYIDLITFTLYVNSFTSPIRKLTAFAEQLVTGMAGLNRFNGIMTTDPTITDKENAIVMTDVKGEIDFDNVSFAYKCDLDVLNHVSLKVNPGETIAIVGPSGGGKTTLCSLLPRFYEVSEGSIRVDGIDIKDVTQHSLHKCIGIVQQDVFLFADTVMNNIRYGKPDASDQEVFEAAKKAEIYDDIINMPDGFNSYVGERGTLLSGGQKQRIAIARIFLKNPKILILDEATSALDTITESKIQSTFDALAKGRTTLIIAHRLSTIRNATRIIVIDGGIISETGTHEQLMEKNGVYANLYNTQTKLHA